MTMHGTEDSGLPEATLFIGGPGLDPDAVTRAIGKQPYRVSRGARARWFWTAAGGVQSPNADDPLRALLDLARAFDRRRRAFPIVELRASLFLPDQASRGHYSKTLIDDLLGFGSMTLNLSSVDEPVVLPRRASGKPAAKGAKAIS